MRSRFKRRRGAAKIMRKLSIHSVHGIGNARLLGRHRAERRSCLSTRAEVLNHLISFFIKFHTAKPQIRFALLGVEWLYIRIQASPLPVALMKFAGCCTCGENRKGATVRRNDV